MGCMKPKVCHKSGEVLTSEEAGRYALIPFDPSNPDESNDLNKNKTVYSYTKKCFEEVSTLDFSRTYDIVEPTSSSSPSGATLVFVHGGGGSRQMYQAHAQMFAAKGHRSILLDLPGHGTMVDKKLTLDSCTETVQSILDENQASMKLTKANTFYVGASFGAYTGFYVLDKLKDRFFGGAIMLDCGQNVGPDCSMKASVGLWFLKLVSKNMSNASLMGSFKDVTAKSPADWKLVESTFGAGMFFDSAEDQVKVLHSVSPADHIPKLDFPILFFNGSEDYRDSEDKWLSLCQVQEGSSLKVYEGGDHFFTHDSRFVDDMVDRMDKFVKDRMA